MTSQASCHVVLQCNGKRKSSPGDLCVVKLTLVMNGDYIAPIFFFLEQKKLDRNTIVSGTHYDRN